MPPKKDNKKKGEGVAMKEVDPSLYLRKPVPLAEPDPEKQFFLPSTSGKIINVETIFPEWKDSDPPEIWSEPIPPEKLPSIRYPTWLSIDKTVNVTTFYELDISDAPIDPKAKKKDPPKKPAGKGKGNEEPIEMVELTVNELGKTLPVVFRGNDGSEEEFKGFPSLRPFAQKPADPSSSAGADGLLDDIDPLLCDAFRLIATFVPLILNDANHQQMIAKNQKLQSLQSNYLWRAIYPKLPNGKPCYNPSGKYCVKVYFAGKWRKVYVDDTIPLTADGKPAVAFSSDRYELWPLLIAKAIYSVYSATGYTFLDDLSEAVLTKNKHFSVPLLSSQFVAFILHILTGWQNHQSIDASNVLQKEKSRSVRLLTYMVNNGIPLINCDDIVQDDGSFRFASEPSPFIEAVPSSDSIDGAGSTSYDEGDNGNDDNYDQTGGNRIGSNNNTPNAITLKTKRRFKEEYLQRKQIRDEIVNKILTREQKIQNIATTLQQGALEVFFVVKYDSSFERYRVYPILGISYYQNELPSHENLEKIQFLLDWQRLPVEDTIPNVNDPIILGKGKIPVAEFLIPFPKASPIRYLWHNVEELRNDNTFITGLFTNIDTPYSAECQRHWISNDPEVTNPDSKANAKDAKKGAGGKDAKGGAAVAPVADEVLNDPGSLPITFLKVDTASIFDAMEAELQLSGAEAVSSEDLAVNSEVKEAVEGQGEELARLEAQQQTNNNNNNHTSSNTDIQFHNYDKHHSTIEKYSVKLVLTLLTDMTSNVETQSNTRTSTMFAASTQAPPRQASLLWDNSGLEDKIHPSDTVVVLQEIRWDEDTNTEQQHHHHHHHHTTPLMFILHMKDTEHLPMKAKIFTIPFERITSREPILFWVRVFTKCSIYFHISSNVNLVMNPAEKIWTDTLGYSAIVREGDSEVCVQETEQLLFRCPIQFRPKTPAATPLVPSEGTEDEQKQLIEQQANALSSSSIGSSSNSKILVFLFVKDFPIEQLLQLLLVNIKSTNQDTEIIHISHPLGQILPIFVQPEYLTQLLAFITPTSPSEQIPKFHWKLLVLSKDILIDPPIERPINETAVSQRFIGKYIANHRYCIFRDVYTMERASFPIALKTTVFPWEYDHPKVVTDPDGATNLVPGSERDEKEEEGEGETPVEELPNNDVPYLLKFYRKSDNTLIAEYGANNILHVYSLPLKPFLPDGEDENTTVKAIDPKAGKAAPPAKAGKGKEAPINPNDNIEIIIECILDTEQIFVPHSWISSFPHVFDEFFPNEANHTSDAIAFYQEILQLQKTYLAMLPPKRPLLSWKLDILSGKVVNVSHDLTSLLQFAEVKKSWEQIDGATNGNRYERALASAAYVKEREYVKKNPPSVGGEPVNAVSSNPGSRPTSKQAPARPVATPPAPSTPGGETTSRSSLQITTTMVESLSQALGLENEEVKNRFSTLHLANKIEEKVELVPNSAPEESLIYPHNPRTRLGSDLWTESVSNRRVEEKKKLEDYYQKLITKSNELTTVYRTNCSERLQLLSQQYLSQRNELLEIWKGREAYRQQIETKNSSLAYLLKRGKDARATAKQQEDAAEAERLKQEAKNAKSNKKK